MRKLIFLGFLFIFKLLSAQVDNEFWFAPPLSTYYDIGDEDDIEFVITAMQATQVTISNPSTGWSFQTPTIGQFGSLSLKLGSDLGLTMADIETPPQTLPLDPVSNPAYNKGLLITSSPGLITVSYKFTNNQDQDQISLKGRNALGTDFYVTTQTSWPNKNNNYYNGFTLVATTDNTTIDIYRNDIWTGFPIAGPYPIKETLTLNQGETYSVQSWDNTIAHHIKGVKVHSDADIAITYWDDQVSKRISAGTYKYDFAGDQLVPETIIGTDYIVMEGGLAFYPTDGGETAFITATVDNTLVSIEAFDGTPITSITLNAGQVQSYAITMQNTVIHASDVIYVNQYSSITNGKTVAAALLPPVGPCTGSHDVVITRSTDASDDYILNILAINDTNPSSTYYNKAVDGFYITVNGVTTQIPPNYFIYNHDSTYIALDKVNFQADYLGSSNPVIDVGETALISNRNSKFHLGVIEGHKNSGSKYGYFSDYGGESARAGVGGPQEDALEVICSLSPIRLVAMGGRTYQWWVDGDSINSLNYLSSLTVSDPIYYPNAYEVRSFHVKMTQQCGGDFEKVLTVITLQSPKAYFDVESEDVCSPDSILITHGVDMPNITLKWYFNSTSLGRTDQSDLVPSFYYNLPVNNSDTIFPFNIELRTTNMGACPDAFTRTINIKPGIHSEFTFIGDSVSCHPLNVTLKNNSSGHIDSTSFFWDFGDHTISYELDSVDHTFYNYSFNDTTYQIQLVAQSPFDCLDTSKTTVTVHPRVKAIFSTTPNQGCSPLKVDVNPVSTIGADTLLWTYNNFYTDSLFTRLDKTSFNITHYDTTVNEGADTLMISMLAKNKYGCSDTAVPHQLLVFPAANADFDISSDVICDADTISFLNKSTGYHLDYYWDLGDGTAPNDTTPADKQYYNPSGTDVIYTLSLATLSENNCYDYKDTILTVHPYVNANFGINYIKNCSPLTVDITNNSYQAQNYTWDMGDGNILNNSSDFQYTYVNPNSDKDTAFTIKLKVSNAQGCYDSISRQIAIKPMVVALMDIQDKEGCSPLSTTFRNLSTGGSYFVWNLGGTSIRTDTVPTDFIQDYLNKTASDLIYPISLTARNDAGCDSTVYDTTMVLAEIIANFNFDKDSSCSPFTPIIANHSSSGSKVFEWYQDNTLFSSAKYPVLSPFVNTGDSPDVHNFKLVTYGANDALHKSCADTFSANLKVFPEMNPQFTLGSLASCQPLITPITNNSNLIDSTSFVWYLDGYVYSGLTNPGNLVINNYTNNDVQHTLTLSAETNHTCAGSASHDVTVYAYITSNFTLDRAAICSGDSFSINRGNSKGAIDNYEWNFGGTIDNRTDVQFDYTFDNTSSAPEKKEITLFVSNAHCDSIWTDSITVYPLVTANFTMPVSTACQPFNASFVNNSINADSYRWNLGDGVSSTEKNPIHTYLNYDPIADRTFNIQLISESQYHCSDTTNGQVVVNAKPEANFFLPKSVSCPPFDFSVINSSSGSNLSYSWNLGNEASSGEFEPTYVFDNTTSGVIYKPISLKVTSDKGCTDSLRSDITVYPGVNVGFTATPLEGCSPLSVTFLGDTTNVQQMVWYVDGSIYSTQIDPTGLFLNETSSNINHDVKIIAYSRYNCIDSSENRITVYPTPSADFLSSPIPAQYDTLQDLTSVNFVNQTRYEDNWSYLWDFGDGNSGNNASANFVYNYGNLFWGKPADNNRVPVRLIASNKNNPECKDTIDRELIILPPVPLVNIGSDVAGCVPLTVDLSPFTKYAYNTNFEWSFGDGQVDVNNLNTQHVFNRAGTFTIKLNVTGDGGPSADYKIVTVYPQPEADFSFNDTVVFVKSLTSPGDQINFYNQTRNGENYDWYFDSENFFNGGPYDSQEKDPTWIYDKIGTYYPVLVAYSGEGCVDTMVSPIPIQVLGEGVLEFPTGFFVDPDAPPADEFNTDQASGNLYLFYPHNNGVSEYKMEIYNRWGVLVFETTDVNQGWNGYIEGVPAKQGVYAWRARGRFTNGKPFDFSGDVTVIKAPVNDKP